MKISQINLFGTQAKKAYRYLFSFGGWILLFLVLWFKGCVNSSNNSNSSTKVTIPAVTKTLPTATAPEIKHIPIEVPKWYKDRKTENKYLKNISDAEEKIIAYQEEIEWMQDEFNYADSIKKIELYRLATELKNFESNFEDEYIKLTINGIIGGNEVKEITPTYTRKEISVPQKQVTFRMLVGGGIGINKELNQGTWKANVGFQNKKGNIIRGSFQRIGNQDYYLAEYDFSLFKITK